VNLSWLSGAGGVPGAGRSGELASSSISRRSSATSSSATRRAASTFAQSSVAPSVQKHRCTESHGKSGIRRVKRVHSATEAYLRKMLARHPLGEQRRRHPPRVRQQRDERRLCIDGHTVISHCNLVQLYALFIQTRAWEGA
jgi:hypothetical protein